MQNLIFLDIDGPMIPDYMFLEWRNPSFERRFCPKCVMILNCMCRKGNALIVTNSTHNWYEGGQTLREAMIREGVKEEYIYPGLRWRTDYGFMGMHFTRMSAIKSWLTKEHPNEFNWIALDDMDFSHEAGDRLLLVDPGEGLTLNIYKKAGDVFGYGPFVV